MQSHRSYLQERMVSQLGVHAVLLQPWGNCLQLLYGHARGLHSNDQSSGQAAHIG